MKPVNETGRFGLWEDVIGLYRDFNSKGDPRIESWPLMQGPLPAISVVVLYVVATIKGPKIMESYKPMNLTQLMLVYNFLMVILSIYMFYEFVMSAVLAGYSLLCQPVDYSNDPLALRMASVGWVYMMSKIIELLDTVFFIVRKKNRQISFLHVYHHATMILITWAGVKFISGGQAFFQGFLNSFVHTFMYAYYGLSALGPEVQKYLWWKKYITKLQIFQFFGVIIHTSYNLFADCNFPDIYNFVVVFYTFSLLVLFVNFYRKCYKENSKKLS